METSVFYHGVSIELNFSDFHSPDTAGLRKKSSERHQLLNPTVPGIAASSVAGTSHCASPLLLPAGHQILQNK